MSTAMNDPTQSRGERWTISHEPRSPLGAYIKGPATREVEVVPAADAEAQLDRLQLNRDIEIARLRADAEALAEALKVIDGDCANWQTGDMWAEATELIQQVRVQARDALRKWEA